MQSPLCGTAYRRVLLERLHSAERRTGEVRCVEHAADALQGPAPGAVGGEEVAVVPA